jgi:nucleoside-diphosphate-sugar epimerase
MADQPGVDRIRAFVAGATGYVGREVVAELRARGVATWAHVRPDSSRLAEWQRRFAALGVTVDSTSWNDDSMTARLQEIGPTHVFALLGTTRARATAAARAGAAPADYAAVDYGLSALLLRAASAVQPAPRFLYLSSAGVREGTRNPYLAARVRLERELRAAPVHYVVARPAFITGADREESRPAERWGARIGDALLAVAGALGGRTLQQRWASITGASLARGLVALALDPAAVNVEVHADRLRG